MEAASLLDPPLVQALGVMQRSGRPESPAVCAVRAEILTIANLPVE